jgi:hypothetical protein
MGVLKREEHLGVDITTEYTVLTYTRPASGTSAIVIPRIDLGVPVGAPVAGDGAYIGRALVDGNQVTPESTIQFATGQEKGILQGRTITLEPGDVLTVTVTGRAGDTAVNVSSALFDGTPIRTEDLDGIIGGGSVEVDHNYGGADTYRYVTQNGVGIDNAIINVYLASDFNAGKRGTDFIKARSLTDINGRWVQPVMLDPETYVVYFYKQLAFGPDTAPLTVTE